MFETFDSPVCAFLQTALLPFFYCHDCDVIVPVYTIRNTSEYIINCTTACCRGGGADIVRPSGIAGESLKP